MLAELSTRISVCWPLQLQSREIGPVPFPFKAGHLVARRPELCRARLQSPVSRLHGLEVSLELIDVFAARERGLVVLGELLLGLGQFLQDPRGLSLRADLCIGRRLQRVGHHHQIFVAVQHLVFEPSASARLAADLVLRGPAR